MARSDLRDMTAQSGAEAPTFETDIKPLFRANDRSAMLFAFDLWSYDDVRQHANRILPAVRAGVMPCDTRWPSEKVDIFRRWVDSEMPR
jgi:hypothetical protein